MPSVMTSLALAWLASKPLPASPLQTMSRSVTIPTSLSSSPIGMQPISCARISFAISVIGVSGLTQSPPLCIASLTFMADLRCCDFRWYSRDAEQFPLGTTIRWIGSVGIAKSNDGFLKLAKRVVAHGLKQAARNAPPGQNRSEETELLRAVADQQVFGLLVVIQHHLVGLAADTRLLVTAERGMRRIGMVAIGPDAACLDGAAETIEPARIAAPDTGAETVERVVGDRKRFVVILEGRDRNHRSENLLLEDAHLVVALEHRRLDIEAAGKVARQKIARSAGQYLGALLAADVDI